MLKNANNEFARKLAVLKTSMYYRPTNNIKLFKLGILLGINGLLGLKMLIMILLEN